MKTGETRFIAISSEIGRGHPSYLDSVLEHLGNLPRLSAHGPGWTLARLLYRAGGLGGGFTSLYNRLRQEGCPARFQLALLDSGLRRRFAGFSGTLLVDHPLLAHLLSPVCRVAYIHGEIAAPPFCAVPTAWRTFVPLNSTAARLIASGIRPETICVTGLVIEPALVAQAEPAFISRLERLSSPESCLTVAFFTSGAYPRAHIRQIIRAARSLSAAGHRAIIFCGTNRTIGKAIASRLPGNCQVEISESRRSENRRTAELFPRFDLMVAASHERTNWAVGLGLPMFALLPHIGPFAQENFNFANTQGVCLPISDAQNFGSTIQTLLRNGRLAEMARSGWGRYPINGARVIAERLGFGS
ncbi:MAG: hypothetical protein ABIK44_02450 [candidate division WOR-3 bacterium]